MTLRGYVVQLDLDLRTVRLRDCPADEGVGALVWEGKCAPGAVRALAQAFRHSTEVQAVVVDGLLTLE